MKRRCRLYAIVLFVLSTFSPLLSGYTAYNASLKGETVEVCTPQGFQSISIAKTSHNNTPTTHHPHAECLLCYMNDEPEDTEAIKASQLVKVMASDYVELPVAVYTVGGIYPFTLYARPPPY